ncbi:MAG: hypothetical protein OJF61_001286 [Rhodanobacteraceae bacterium]|nr:MAG: hypothetical protein OJF61_001286 [Rhodanobacteraceae bacterium]
MAGPPAGAPRRSGWIDFPERHAAMVPAAPGSASPPHTSRHRWYITPNITATTTSIMAM